MARFVNAQVPEVVQPFWAALQRGEFIADAAVAVGTYRKQGTRWVASCGGVRPRRGRDLRGRCLSFAEREEIALARARGETMRAIARRLGRSPSTISRELRRNADQSSPGAWCKSSWSLLMSSVMWVAAQAGWSSRTSSSVWRWGRSSRSGPIDAALR
jgi:hypothetical protein